MNIRDLQYLTAVADHLHYGKAARAVHVSQPTLSMQLKKLEATLGVQLFERNNKHVSLTPIGENIVARARRVLAEVSNIKLAANAARDPLAGTLRLGIFPTLAPYLLPLLMPSLRQQFPNITILLVEEKTPELIRQLEAGALDCALLALPVVGEGLSNTHLFREPFLLAVARNHHLASRKSVRVGDLTQETVLLLEDGHCLRDQALEVCQRVGATHQMENFRATSLETLRHMVAASDAVTLMPKLACRDDDPSTRYIPFATPVPARDIGLIWRKTSGRTALFTAIGDLVRAVCKDVGA